VGEAGGGLIRGGAGRIKDALDPMPLASLALATGVTSAYVVGGGGGRIPRRGRG